MEILKLIRINNWSRNNLHASAKMPCQFTAIGKWLGTFCTLERLDFVVLIHVANIMSSHVEPLLADFTNVSHSFQMHKVSVLSQSWYWRESGSAQSTLVCLAVWRQIGIWTSSIGRWGDGMLLSRLNLTVGTAVWDRRALIPPGPIWKKDL